MTPVRPVVISSRLGATRGIQHGPRPSNSRLPGLFPRPHLAVFAGVHGNEIASQHAAAILAQAARVVGPVGVGIRDAPDKISGTLTVFVNANPAGTIAGMRYAPQWAGGDEHDLNRAFGPDHTAQSGQPGGAPERQHAEEISTWIETYMQSGPSLVLDMHEGIPPLDSPPDPMTPLWYAADLISDSDTLIPGEVAGIKPATWTHSQLNSLTGDAATRLKVGALVQETDHTALDLRSRIELHIAGVVACAARIGLTIEVDRSQVEFMLRYLAPVQEPTPPGYLYGLTLPDPPTS